MPIYEYYCPDNHKIYSFHARSLAQREKTPRCPDNPRHRMVKIVSGFSITGRAARREEAENAAPEDDPRMEAAMAQVTSEMSALDEENPDPRQIGRLMRRMSEMSGEKIPPEMEEITKRLEAGEDPEKLEEQFGDLADDLMDSEAGEDEMPPGKNKPGRHRAAPPARDPALYDLADYI